MAAVAAALGIEQLIVVGYSMGGLIAQLVWRRHRQPTAGLVLCATARSLTSAVLVHPSALLTTALTTSALLAPALPAPTSRAPARSLPGWTTAAMAESEHGGFSALAAFRADLLGRYLLDVDSDSDRRAWALAQMRRTPLVSALAAVCAVYRFSSHGWVGDIDVPTAVIIPRRDRIVPPTRQHKLAAAIPAAVTYDVDGDHGVFLTAPGRFLAALRATCGLVSESARTTDNPVPPATAS